MRHPPPSRLRADGPQAPSPEPGPYLVLGSTGLVGGALVRELLAAGATEVRVPGRRPPQPMHPALRFQPLDFQGLVAGAPAPNSVFAGLRSAAICLGTTMRTAGSREAFRRVDLDFVVAAARAAREGGCPLLTVVSSVGAGPASRSFYLRVKGEMEGALAALGFEALVVARPSLLTGPREERRPGERLAIALLSPLAPLLRGPLTPLRPIPAATVGRALARILVHGPPGPGRVQVLEPGELRRAGS